MPQIKYKDYQEVVIPLTLKTDEGVTIPHSQHYLGFNVQLVDALCVAPGPGGADGGFRVEVSLNGVDWATLHSADLYSPDDPHFHEGSIITFSLRAHASGGIRLAAKADVTTAGKVLVSMYERAYPPQV